VLVRPPGGSPFLVDAGPTMMVALMQEGAGHADIDRLFLTHLHGDHTAGWPFLLLHLMILQQRTRPFDVFGPVGTREVLEGLAGLCYGDLFDVRRFDLRYHELEVDEVLGIAAGEGVSLDTVPMQHHTSSIGLRFHISGPAGPHVLAVSGDTGWCDNLERLARGCHMILLECTSVEPLIDTHLSLVELREKVDRLGADRIVLVHLTDQVAQQLAIDPIARVDPATDGMSLEMP
jgi:ribonuclease BN (tRNA processing enzyme)